MCALNSQQKNNQINASTSEDDSLRHHHGHTRRPQETANKQGTPSEIGQKLQKQHPEAKKQKKDLGRSRVGVVLGRPPGHGVDDQQTVADIPVNMSHRASLSHGCVLHLPRSAPSTVRVASAPVRSNPLQLVRCTTCAVFFRRLTPQDEDTREMDHKPSVGLRLNRLLLHDCRCKQSVHEEHVRSRMHCACRRIAACHSTCRRMEYSRHVRHTKI